MGLVFLVYAALTAAPAAPVTARKMPAQASVRILAGARVHLGPASKPQMVKAAVRVEDGRRRPAYLIEFE